MGRKKNIVKHIEELGRYRVVEETGHFAVHGSPGISGARFEKDGAFWRARQQNSVFKQCAEAASLLRQQLSPLLRDVRDRRLNARLLQLMYGVLQTDARPKGQQAVYEALNNAAGCALLEGFELLDSRQLRDTLITASDPARGIFDPR